jgi:DNA-binding transcriptional regulator LsrR (DeoR family)
MADKDLLLRVARLSFDEGLFNEDIAEIFVREKILKPSKKAARHVQELIEEAGHWLLEEKARLAEIEATPTLEHKLAADLCTKFGLLDARVVPGGDVHASNEYLALLKKYARAAADYFDQLADADGGDLHVLVSGGQPILDMVSSLTDRKRHNVFYYAAALIGRGSMTEAPHVGSETNATVAWSRSGRLPNHLYYGTVPPYEVHRDEMPTSPSKKERHEFARKAIGNQRKELLSQRFVFEDLAKLNEKVNIAFAGLGIPFAGDDAKYGVGHIERLTMTELLRPLGIDPELLAREGAVGDISYCLFDKNGEGRDEWKFFITAGDETDHEGVEFYRNLVAKGHKVIVIGGARKESALRPALKAKLFNVLITDAFAARKLLDC